MGGCPPHALAHPCAACAAAPHERPVRPARPAGSRQGTTRPCVCRAALLSVQSSTEPGLPQHQGPAATCVHAVAAPQASTHLLLQPHCRVVVCDAAPHVSWHPLLPHVPADTQQQQGGRHCAFFVWQPLWPAVVLCRPGYMHPAQRCSAAAGVLRGPRAATGVSVTGSRAPLDAFELLLQRRAPATGCVRRMGG